MKDSTETLQLILDTIEEGTQVLKADGFDEAIIGYAMVNDVCVLIYLVSKCIEILEAEGMERVDAIEHFTYNVSGAYVGEQTPIWCQDEFYW